jgi:hypothetical protein
LPRKVNFTIADSLGGTERMTNLDQFESVFKSADRHPFSEQPITLENILVVTDGNAEQAEQFTEQLRQFLSATQETMNPSYSNLTGDRFAHVQQLLEMIEQDQPDLICTVRNLHDAIPDFPYSLGTYVDVMTQVIACPVLLVPRSNNWSVTNEVMAITDHLSGDDRLVSYAASLTADGGKLVLAHVEDQQAFARYIDTIGKIPTIDTQVAEEVILEQLLKQPADYILSCQQALEERPEHNIHLEAVITLGHLLEDYKRLIEQHEIDLLVLNTKDDDQLAMHGLAYPLAIELREIPLLLL